MTVESKTPAPIMAQPVIVVGGHTGPAGGATGPTGPIGLPSAVTGPTGALGPIGPTGAEHTGPTGVGAFTGPTGYTGPPGGGPIGPTGMTGPTGPPAYLTGRTKSMYDSGTYGPYGARAQLGFGNTIQYLTHIPGGFCQVTFSGTVRNSAGAGGGETQVVGWSGTGVPPAQGANSPGGSAFAWASQRYVSSDAGQYAAFYITAFVNLTTNSYYWFDISIQSTSGGGSAYVRDLQFTLVEF
ncbi:MAG TPA: hypothetical protein VF077_05415 [Nitrospiraceae bacterium]